MHVYNENAAKQQQVVDLEHSRPHQLTTKIQRPPLRMVDALPQQGYYGAFL